MGEWLSPILAFVGVVLSFLGGWATSRANTNAINVKTFQELVNQVQDISDELVKVKSNMSAMDGKNRVLWQYVYALIENSLGHKVVPPDPPKELESDPRLMKILEQIRNNK